MSQKSFLDYSGLSRLAEKIRATYVPKNTKVNGKPLTSDIIITAEDLDIAHLVSIAITHPPNQIIYVEGSSFDPTGMVVEASYSDGTVVTVSNYTIIEADIPLTPSNKFITVQYVDSGIVKTATQPVTIIEELHIYGVEWDWENNRLTKGVRTDDAALFPDPVPAVNNGTGSSPFDDLYPWSEMTKEIRIGGVEVKEPKYWFRWTKIGKKLKVQIATGPVEGFSVDPVNMDRGDGLGELDFSYIGRYHCGQNTNKSETGEYPINNSYRASCRKVIHDLGDSIWQIDFNQFWYIGMLMLVEYADWDIQKCIGYGNGPSSSSARKPNGATDPMQYHTGTDAVDRYTGGAVQYRNIEGWWSNLYQWYDGCYYNGSGLWVIQNPSLFDDTQGGVLVGKPPSSGFPTEFAIPSQTGLNWALYPVVLDGSDSTCVPDYWSYSGAYPSIMGGGSYLSFSKNSGPFMITYSKMYESGPNVGCRLQERPPKEGVTTE